MLRAILILLLGAAWAPGAARNNQTLVDSFELVWTTLRDHYWDHSMAGLNWQQLHDRYLPKVKAAKSVGEARQAMDEMIHKLPSSHLAIIPGEAYGEVSDPPPNTSGRPHGGSGSTGIIAVEIDDRVVVEFSESPDVHTGWIIDSIDGEDIGKLVRLAGIEIVSSWLSGPLDTPAHIVFTKGDGKQTAVDVKRKGPAGKLVEFTNLPPLRVMAEHRKLANGAGYIRLNIFLDPVSVMPEFEAAIAELRSTPGMVLDLRGNHGGLGVMAMGLAGWFVPEEGERLGTMIGRTAKTEFEINPRIEPYTGKLAIVVNHSSASTTEILAQGLKDLGRARIFGTKTAGAALPSEAIELPDGDRFQYPEATYISAKGRVLEGNGVEPDEVAAPTIAALLAGHDVALEAAMKWVMK